MHRLRFTAGPLAGRHVEVTSTLVLGRQAELALDDPQVSRRHAALRPAGEALELEDLGSLNGTWVNGTRVEGPVRLAPGDRVRLGASAFEVEGPARAAAAAPTVAGHAPRPDPAPAPPATAAPAPPLPPFSPPPQRVPRRRGVASRRLTPTLLSFGVVVATAVALVLYFAMR
jgi:predicted component of type VI protein secretion system